MRNISREKNFLLQAIVAEVLSFGSLDQQNPSITPTIFVVNSTFYVCFVMYEIKYFFKHHKK